MATTSVMDDFKTPDRKPASSDHAQQKVTSSVDPERKITKAATVTPAEVASTREPVKADPPALEITSSVEASPEDKHVRFDKKKQEQDSAETPEATNRRGEASRRGGRGSSPGRSGKEMESTVLEFKTYRSPERKRDESDTVPSLCSTSSADKEKEQEQAPKAETKETKETSSEEHNKPASISCDANLNQTSPLGESEMGAATKSKSAKSEKTDGKKNNVTFSPVPPTKDNAVVRVS